MSEAFSLRAIIREVLAENDSEDMGVLVKDVKSRIPRKHMVAALNEALVPYMRSLMTEKRFHKPGPDSDDGERDPRESAGDASPGSDRDSEARVAHFNAYIERCLDERWAVKDHSSRRLRDMTVDDCAFLAAKQKTIGRTHMAKGAFFDSFHSALAEYGARTIGELPEDFLISMFRRAA